MANIIRAEYLKQRRSFAGRLPVLAPLVTLLLVLLLTGGMDGAFPAGAWNWWYTFLLPGMLALLCYLSSAADKKLRYFSLLALPAAPRRLLLGKVLYIALCLLWSNLVVMCGAWAGGAVFGGSITVVGSAAAALLLSVSFLWEIPLYLWLSDRFGMLAGLLSSLALSVSGTVTLADSGGWWLYPPSIPVRLMCPTLGLLPNGLPVPAGSELMDKGVLVSGIGLSLLLFAGLTALYLAWFGKREL